MIVAAIYVVLGLSATLFLVRVLIGPTVPERVVGVDGAIVTFIAAILVNAADTGRGPVVAGARGGGRGGVISTSVVARYLEGNQP